MVKINPLVADLSGSIGGITFSRNAYGPYAKRKASPVQPQTPAQMANRSAWSGIAKAWTADLNQGQRDGWAGLATRVSFTDVFGLPQKLAANTLFQMINMQLYTAGVVRLDAAPLNLNVRSIVSANFGSFNPGDSSFEVDFVQDCTATEKLVLLGVKNVNPGVSFVKGDLRIVSVSAAAQTASWIADWPVAGGDFILGAKVVGFLRRINLVNGAMTPGLRIEGTVTAV